MLKYLLMAALASGTCIAGASGSTGNPAAVLSGEVSGGPAQERMTLGQIRVSKRAAWGHPNELWRLYGLEAVQLGRQSAAAEYFERAALYADKYSQHRLSLMYWDGDGVVRDRSTAYVWADLAAERGYRDLLLIREKMWSEMSEHERDAVSAIGAEIFERFGDANSKPRLEKRLRYALVHATGSRTGASIASIRFLVKFGADIIPANFWARERWYPEEYWKEVNAAWGGYVEVQPLQKAASTEPQ